VTPCTCFRAWRSPRKPAFATSRSRSGGAWAAVLAAALALGAPPASAAGTVRVSVGIAGAEPNAASFAGAISRGGRFVAFTSSASNLVPGDANGVDDIFVHDLLTGAVERVSVRSDGAEANGPSEVPDISADGRFVAFWSEASNLVPGDANGVADVFVHDRLTQQTERVSLADDETEANGDSFGLAISGDGRFVAFCSNASNLVPGDSNGRSDIFRRDRLLGITIRASVSSAGVEGDGTSCMNSAGDISTDGRFVTFPSIATNLVPDDTNGRNDVFVRDVDAGVTERVSVSTAGSEGNGLSAWPALDDDGRFVVYSSTSDNLVPDDGNATWDVFLRDRQAGTTERATLGPGGQANLNSGYAAVSDDGRYVAFFSYATNLVAADGNGIGDVFVRDRTAGSTERVSVDSAGNEAVGANLEIGTVHMSSDGAKVSFFFSDAGLVPGDSNGVSDVFVRDRTTVVLPGPPPPPASCVASDDLGCEVLVSWSASPGATGYRVTRDGLPIGETSGSSWSDAVQPGSHEYCVKAFNADGESAPVCDAGQAVPPPSYDRATGHYYEVVPGSLPTWTAARDAAAARRLRGVNGHLVTITSPEEQAFVRALPGGAIGLFLGGYQLPGSPEPAGGWVWVTGEGFTYQNWAPGEPNDQSGSGPEGWLIWQDALGRWNDVRHDNTNVGYIVEYEPPFLLAAPGSVQASDGTDCAVHLAWNAVAQATGYRVYRDGALLATLGAGATSFDDAGTPPRQHAYCVEAFNACGGSARACDTGSATAPPPAGLTATDGERCVVNVSWSAVAAASGYFVYRDGQLIRSLGPGVTAIRDTLLPGTYQYGVTCLNPCGESEPALDAGTSSAAPPFDPVGGNYYELVVAPVTWDDARAVADAQALVGVPGHLVTVTDQLENYFVSELIGSRDAWIGAFQPPGTPEPGDGWQWVTGEPWDFTRWLPGEPNQLAGEEDCGRYKTIFGLQGWNDERCFIPSEAFVVEYDHRAPLAGPQTLFTQSANYRVTLQWPALVGAGIQGSRVYRGGTLLAQLPRTQLSYVDEPIVGTYVYCVRTFNRCGAESQPACALGTGTEPPPPPPPPPPHTGEGPTEPHRPFLTDEVIPAPNPGRDFTLHVGLARGGLTRISVHDAAGREVARLADRYFPPGASRVHWNGQVRGGGRARPGLYLVRMRVGGEERVQRVVLLER